MNQWSTVDLERHFLLFNSNCLLGKGVFKDLYVQAPERTTEDQENTPLPVILLIMKSAQFSVITVALKIEETAEVGTCRDSMELFRMFWGCRPSHLAHLACHVHKLGSLQIQPGQILYSSDPQETRSFRFLFWDITWPHIGQSRSSFMPIPPSHKACVG
jgi:hypothetical protein